MIALQEELDWEVYRLYGLIDRDDLTARCDALDECSLGQRASRSSWPDGCRLETRDNMV